MTEAQLGILWQQMARAEGHMKRLPQSQSERQPHPYSVRIREMVEGQGMKHQDVGRILGISKSRVTQICTQYGIKA